MSASLRSRLDLAELSEQLSSLNRTRSPDELAETFLRLLKQTLGQDHILLVLLDPDDNSPTVYGGSFEKRREIRAGLLGSALRDGVVDLAASIGEGMRIVPVRDGRVTRGVVLVEGRLPSMEADLDYVRFLADRAAEALPRHSLQTASAIAPRVGDDLDFARSGSETPATATSPRAKRPVRVLCIEEDPTSLGLLNAIFERGGHQVECAVEAQTAAAMFWSNAERGTPFDLVVAGLSATAEEFFQGIRKIRLADAAVGILIVAPEGVDLPSDLRSERRIRTLTRLVDPVAIRFCVEEMLAERHG